MPGRWLRDHLVDVEILGAGWADLGSAGRGWCGRSCGDRDLEQNHDFQGSHGLAVAVPRPSGRAAFAIVLTPRSGSGPLYATRVVTSGSGGLTAEVTSLLGRGGMGTVYLARDITLDRDIALKIHRPGTGDARLKREAIAMAQLAHPNVVNVFEVATVDDRMVVAMEYVRGTTLRGWLEARPRRWREIVAMLVEAGRGLAAAHAAGLVHRDFKPENALVTDGSLVCVADFGLVGQQARAAVTDTHADAAPADARLTRSGTVLGTPAGTPGSPDE